MTGKTLAEQLISRSFYEDVPWSNGRVLVNGLSTAVEDAAQQRVDDAVREAENRARILSRSRVAPWCQIDSGTVYATRVVDGELVADTVRARHDTWLPGQRERTVTVQVTTGVSTARYTQPVFNDNIVRDVAEWAAKHYSPETTTEPIRAVLELMGDRLDKHHMGSVKDKWAPKTVTGSIPHSVGTTLRSDADVDVPGKTAKQGGIVVGVTSLLSGFVYTVARAGVRSSDGGRNGFKIGWLHETDIHQCVDRCRYCPSFDETSVQARVASCLQVISGPDRKPRLDPTEMDALTVIRVLYRLV
jgi:hypothetical protein